MGQDWFTQNAPQSTTTPPPAAAQGTDWFAANSPITKTPAGTPGQSDNRSLWQKAKDNFNAATQGAKPGDGVIKSAVEDFGAGGGDIIRAIAHPVRTAASMLNDSDPTVNLRDKYLSNPQSFSNTIKSGEQTAIQNLAPSPSIARTVGQVGTAAILGDAVAPVVRAVTPLVTGAGADGGVVTPSLANKLGTDRIPLVNKLGVGELPTALTPAEKSAVEITKAVNPAQPSWNNYLQAAHDQMGNVIDYAERNGMPIANARDLAKAAKGAQQETLTHYQDNFLTPNADTTVPIVDTGYQGPMTGSGRATLADINSRVNAINQELSSNFRKPTTGQAASAGASDAELIAEKQNLTKILHQSLADATGVDPSDISALRIRGGQLGTIASETQGAANTLSGGAAKVDAGAPSLPTSKSGIISEGITYVRGGPERIASGKLMDALNKSPIETTPLIQPKITPEAPTITTPEAAQAEYLKAQQLQQSAQDASTQRGAQANAARLNNRVATGSELWASQGYSKVLSHLQIDPSSGISRPDLVKFGLTPQGMQTLVKASDLTPGSPAMRGIVAQIATSVAK